MIRQHQVRRSVRSEAGAATAELAIFLPLTFVLVLGAVDFGRAMYELTEVANAATSGAKYGAHDTAHSGDINGMENAAYDDLSDSIEVEDVSVEADRYCVCDDGTEINCTTGTCAGGNAERRTYVRVRVEKAFNTLFPYPGVPESVMIAREAQMRVQ